MDAISSFLLISITDFESCIILTQVFSKQEKKTQKKAELYIIIFAANIVIVSKVLQTRSSQHIFSCHFTQNFI